LHFATRKTLDDDCAEVNECAESAVADLFLRKIAELIGQGILLGKPSFPPQGNV
jgi:hypothetical protein